MLVQHSEHNQIKFSNISKQLDQVFQLFTYTQPTHKFSMRIHLLHCKQLGWTMGIWLSATYSTTTHNSTSFRRSRLRRRMRCFKPWISSSDSSSERRCGWMMWFHFICSMAAIKASDILKWAFSCNSSNLHCIIVWGRLLWCNHFSCVIKSKLINKTLLLLLIE